MNEVSQEVEERLHVEEMCLLKVLNNKFEDEQEENAFGLSENELHLVKTTCHAQYDYCHFDYHYRRNYNDNDLRNLTFTDIKKFHGKWKSGISGNHWDRIRDSFILNVTHR